MTAGQETASGPQAQEDSPLGRFEAYLRGRNLRLTSERRTVLDIVLSREGHFDADSLLQFVRHRRESKRVSRATLYRTLEHLQAAGLVKMHRFGSGQALFEHVYNRRHHDHMVCRSCEGWWSSSTRRSSGCRSRSAGSTASAPTTM